MQKWVILIIYMSLQLVAESTVNTCHSTTQLYHIWCHYLHVLSWNKKKMFIKGCGMGPWLVHVSPCFWEKVVATCKIGSFLCSLDNLLQKNIIVFFFRIQISKWSSFEKGLFWPTFHIFSSPGKRHKNSFSIYLTNIHTHILLTLLTFFALPILKNWTSKFFRSFKLDYYFTFSDLFTSDLWWPLTLVWCVTLDIINIWGFHVASMSGFHVVLINQV